MAAPNPVTDPLYAYDTFGWTNQQTGDVPNVAQLGSASLLGPNEAIVQNYIAETLDPQSVTHAAANIVSGTIYGAKLVLAAPAYVTNASIWSVAAGTATKLFTGIYNVNGALMSSSADVHAGLGTQVLVTGAQTAPVALSAGIYYVALAAVWSVQPTVNAITAATAATQFGGQGLAVPASGQPFTNASPRWATLGSGVATALPATVTPSAAAFSAVGFWAGLS